MPLVLSEEQIRVLNAMDNSSNRRDVFMRVVAAYSSLINFTGWASVYELALGEIIAPYMVRCVFLT